MREPTPRAHKPASPSVPGLLPVSTSLVPCFETRRYPACPPLYTPFHPTLASASNSDQSCLLIESVLAVPLSCFCLSYLLPVSTSADLSTTRAHSIQQQQMEQSHVRNRSFGTFPASASLFLMYVLIQHEHSLRHLPCIKQPSLCTDRLENLIGYLSDAYWVGLSRSQLRQQPIRPWMAMRLAGQKDIKLDQNIPSSSMHMYPISSQGIFCVQQALKSLYSRRRRRLPPYAAYTAYTTTTNMLVSVIVSGTISDHSYPRKDVLLTLCPHFNVYFYPHNICRSMAGRDHAREISANHHGQVYQKKKINPPPSFRTIFLVSCLKKKNMQVINFCL